MSQISDQVYRITNSLNDAQRDENNLARYNQLSRRIDRVTGIQRRYQSNIFATEGAYTRDGMRKAWTRNRAYDRSVYMGIKSAIGGGGVNALLAA